MTSPAADLVVLAADRQIEAAVRGLLSRPKALKTRDISCKIFTHPKHDPGCLLHAHEFLKSQADRFARAMIVFDRHGCGAESRSAQELETEVAERLASYGWGERAAAVVLDPELEVWIWSDSPHVDQCLGWRGREPDLRNWLCDEGMWPSDAPKPANPKLAVNQALRQVRKPRSSAIFRALAASVSFDRCTDAAFLRLRRLLAAWFPPEMTR